MLVFEIFAQLRTNEMGLLLGDISWCTGNYADDSPKAIDCPQHGPYLG